MMKRIMLLISVCLTGFASADEIRFAPGVAVQAAVTLVADADGVLQIDRSKPILIGSLPPTNPTDPSPPTDPISTDPVTPGPEGPLVGRVSALVELAPTQTENERQAVIQLFKTTGSLPLTDPAQIREATTILFEAMPLGQPWKEWKPKLDAFAAGLSAADTKRAWQLIAEALE